MRDLITAYTFDKTAKTITFTGINPIVPEKVLGIWNATRGIKYYDPHTTGYGATFATNVITLVDAVTSSHANTDDLIIFYEGAASTDLASQTTLAALLAKVIAAPSTEAKQDDAITYLAAILANDVNRALENGGNLEFISARQSAIETNTADIEAALNTLLGVDFATGAKQDVLQATADAINGKTPAMGTAVISASTPVNIASDQVVPVSATALPLPANAAQETGGNLAAIAASVSVLDDWDESDRAKVNPIAGQAGVQGGSGTANALTQRMVLATDVALPAGTNRLGSARLVDSADADLTTTKGTQASRAVAVQTQKEGGRTAIAFSATAIAAGTSGTETAITLVKSSGTAATSSAASFVITSGKRFVIQSIALSARGHATATLQTTVFNFRLNTAGAVTTASTPVLMSVQVSTQATAGQEGSKVLTFADGYEILGDGTLQIGVTANAVYTTNAPTWGVNIVGYEY